MIIAPYLIIVAPDIESHGIEKGLGSWSIKVRVWCSADKDAFDYSAARREVKRAVAASGLELDMIEHSVKDPSPLLRIWEFTLAPMELPASDSISEAMEAFFKLYEASRLRKKEQK